MKKVILILFILSVNFSFSQQCKLSLDQLFKVMNYNRSDFDTFALKNGFSYNSQDQAYFCDKNKNKDKRNLLTREEQSEITVLIYSFYDKKDYLNFKEIIENGELTETYNENDALRFQYFYDGKIIIIQTSTYIDGSKIYMISISSTK